MADCRGKCSEVGDVVFFGDLKNNIVGVHPILQQFFAGKPGAQRGVVNNIGVHI
ncbi:hypothetical protein SDC9_191612 [bioreactor metagenome]|uniref:Uncharacterized protein n=1 Tax=bioreactor metagenome TaxID=1076179 RepID=A0A645HYC8_9ZZZZ